LTNTDPHNAAHVTTNIPGTGRGSILTGPAMDTHNTFAAPDTIHPVPFVANSAGGNLAIDLPARSVVVVAVEPE
jgi:alpha-N-arabinofuranosidase